MTTNYSRSEDVDAAIETFAEDAAYKERARLFRELDRWTGDDPVVLVVDAAATTMGERYFGKVKPQVEGFRDEFVETGDIVSFRELASAKEELDAHLPGERKQHVAMKAAAVLAERPETSDLASLQAWADDADPWNYRDDPIGEITGVGLRTFQYLRMLAGVDAIKPDTHVIKFVKALREKLPEAPLETDSDQSTLESCHWLAANSSFDLLEIDQIAWWHFADVPPEKRERETEDDHDEGLRVIVKTVDRDAFEVLPWGKLENGEIIQTYQEAEELFHPFEEFVEYIKDRSIRSEPDISDEVFWLRECRSFGSQAHRERASVLHPAIDRALLYPQGPLVGALRGLDADGSTYDDVIELDLTEPYLGRSASSDGHTVTVRYEMPNSDEDSSPSQEALDDQALPTAENIIREVVAATQFEHRIDGVSVNAIEIVGYQFSQTVWKLRIDYETAATINWDTYETGRLRQDAIQYVNLGH